MHEKRMHSIVNCYFKRPFDTFYSFLLSSTGHCVHSHISSRIPRAHEITFSASPFSFPPTFTMRETSMKYIDIAFDTQRQYCPGDLLKGWYDNELHFPSLPLPTTHSLLIFIIIIRSRHYPSSSTY